MDTNEGNPRLKWRTSEQRRRKALKKYIHPRHRQTLEDAFNETTYPSDYSTSSGEDEFIQKPERNRRPRKKGASKEWKNQCNELNKVMDQKPKKPAYSLREYDWRTSNGEKNVPVTPLIAARYRHLLYPQSAYNGR